jgi:hypothetical protein
VWSLFVNISHIWACIYRYFRQGDLLRIEEEKRREMQHKLDSERAQKETKEKELSLAAPSVSETSESMREKQGNNSFSSTLNSLSKLSISGIKSKLRNMNHPITLFGESDDQRTSRLAAVICELREEEDDYRLKGAYEAEGKESKDKKSAGGSGSSSTGKDSQHVASARSGMNAQQKHMETMEEVDLDRSDGVLPSDDHDVDDDHDAKHTSGSGSFVKGQVVTSYSTTDGLSKFVVVYKYFRNLLKQWEWDLDDREDVEKNSSKGE